MIYTMLAGLALAGISIVFGKLFKSVVCFLFKSAVGIAAIFVMDFLLSPFGLAVGLNMFTVAFVGILGIPGFVTLYVVTWLLNMGLPLK
jgi:hypothetical protein